MKAFPAKFILILTVGFLAAGGLVQGAAEERQPHMEAALHFLQEAKTSASPGEALHSAKHELDIAAHNKHGWRVISLEKLDQAIQALEAGDTQRMKEKIDATIADVHDAMAHANGRR